MVLMLFLLFVATIPCGRYRWVHLLVHCSPVSANSLPRERRAGKMGKSMVRVRVEGPWQAARTSVKGENNLFLGYGLSMELP